jgi:hypothetical protein
LNIGFLDVVVSCSMKEVQIGLHVVKREQRKPKNVFDNICSVKLIFRDPVISHFYRHLINEVARERIFKN